MAYKAGGPEGGDDMGWEGMDRRKFPRIMYPCLVKVISSAGTHGAILTHTENIGLGGLCVTLKDEIKLFTSVEMEVDLLDLNEHIKPKGKVVWNVRRKSIEKIKPMFYDTGIEFTEISKRDYESLRENLQQLIDKGVQLSKPYI
jgi:Tfp pilus assembly protein PilZ